MKQDKSGNKSVERAGAFLVILATVAGCKLAEAPPTCVDAIPMPLDPLDPTVTRVNCSREAVVITIDSARRNSELWVLEETPATPSTAEDGWMSGAWLNDERFLTRSQALVQINGFVFQCWDVFKGCYQDIFGARPVTRVYESTQPIGTWQGDFTSDWPLSFGPRNPTSGISIQLGAEKADPAYDDYNVVGSNFFLLRTGENQDCAALTWGWDENDPTKVEDATGIGYTRLPDASVSSIFMVYAPAVTVEEMCYFMQGLGATEAVLMDGGSSAGIYLKDLTTIGHVAERNIPYRIGLVALEEQNRVQNGGFESPHLLRRPSKTPPGFHSYSVDTIRENMLWNGAMFLYNTPLYNAWTGDAGMHLPSHSDQIAAIWTRGDDTNYIMQELTVPADRYCMLHFFHGYNNSNSPECPDQSTLHVTTELTTAEYHSDPTIGPYGRLNEVWLRLLTPSTSTSGSDTTMRLSFTAKKENKYTTPGNCEVLLDDVSVHCVQ